MFPRSAGEIFHYDFSTIVTTNYIFITSTIDSFSASTTHYDET